MSITDRIKSRREELGISQAELARRSGLKPPGISQYESGLRNPSYEALIRLSSALGVSTDFLVSGVNQSPSIVQEKTGAILNRVIDSLTVENREKLLDYALYLTNNRHTKSDSPLFASAIEYGEHIFKTFCNSTLPIDIQLVAKKLGVSVVEDDLCGEAEGLLMRSAERSYLVLDKKVSHPQRKRFIMASLLGHLVIPWHLKDVYMIRRKGASSLFTENTAEIEAQKFGAYLLMPPIEVLDSINAGKPSLQEIKLIAYKKFDVSLFAFLNQLVDIDSNHFAVVQSANYEITKTFQGNRVIVDNINENSIAYSFHAAPTSEEEVRGGEVAAEYWFIDALPGELIYEESIFNPEYKSVLTLLTTK